MCGVVVVISGLLGFSDNGVGLVFYHGFFFFFGVDGRLWDAGGGGVRCVLCSGGGDCGS